MSKRRKSLVAQQSAFSASQKPTTPSSSSQDNTTTTAKEQEQHEQHASDINKKHMEQCIELKKNIYDRWEKSIMSRNNFSPSVNKMDVPSSPRSNSSNASDRQHQLQDVQLPVEITTTPRRNESNETKTTTTNNTATTNSSTTDLPVSPPTANKTKSTPPPLSPSLKFVQTAPPTPPAMSIINDAVSPIEMPLDDTTHTTSEERGDARPLPSKSVRRDGDLINKVGQKLEDQLSTSSSTSTTSTSAGQHASTTQHPSHGTQINNSVSSLNGVDSPLPLFTFSDGKVDTSLSTTNENGSVDSNVSFTKNNIVQKPPPGPKPTLHRPHTLSASSLATTTPTNHSTVPSQPSFQSEPLSPPSSIPSPASQPPPDTTKPQPTAAAVPKKIPTIPRPKTGINVPMIYPPPHHMRWVPEQPEVLHVARDRLVASMMEHDANRLLSQSSVRNRVVYDSIEPPPSSTATAAKAAAVATTATDSNPSSSSSSSSSSKTDLKAYYTLESEKDSTLIFESRFESGNLRRSIQVYDNGK